MGHWLLDLAVDNTLACDSLANCVYDGTNRDICPGGYSSGNCYHNANARAHSDAHSPTYGNAKPRSYGGSADSGDCCRYTYRDARAYTHCNYSTPGNAEPRSHGRSADSSYSGGYAHRNIDACSSRNANHCACANTDCYPDARSNGGAGVCLGQDGRNRLPRTLRLGYSTHCKSCGLGSETSNFRQWNTFSDSPNQRWTQSDTARRGKWRN